MRVLLFAHLRDVTGRNQFELTLDGPVDADGLWRRLIAEQPGLAAFRASVRLARNAEYAPPDARFTDTDEVALIPPVSGG